MGCSGVTGIRRKITIGIHIDDVRDSAVAEADVDAAIVAHSDRATSFGCSATKARRNRRRELGVHHRLGAEVFDGSGAPLGVIGDDVGYFAG